MLRGSQVVVGLWPCLVAALASAAVPERPHVVILKSADLSPYAALAAGFTAEVRAQVEEVTLDEGADAAAKTLKKVAEKHPALVLAIGPAAAVGAHRQLTDTPILFAMVPYYEKYELEGPHITGIALTSDLSLELAAVKALVPDGKRVGVVEDPRFSQKLIDGAAAIAQGQGLTLVPLEVDGPPRLEKVLKGAKGKIDALVLISDRTVGNAAMVQRVIAWSVEEKVPAVGLAPGQVKEGALIALTPAATGLGLQAGRLANRILHEKVDPGALAVAPPEGVDLHCNLKTARQLFEPKRFALDLVTFAAQKNLAVKVTE